MNGSCSDNQATLEYCTVQNQWKILLCGPWNIFTGETYVLLWIISNPSQNNTSRIHQILKSTEQNLWWVIIHQNLLWHTSIQYPTIWYGCQKNIKQTDNTAWLLSDKIKIIPRPVFSNHTPHYIENICQWFWNKTNWQGTYQLSTHNTKTILNFWIRLVK